MQIIGNKNKPQELQAPSYLDLHIHYTWFYTQYNVMYADQAIKCQVT